MLAAGFWVERAIDPLDQPVGQQLGALRAETGLVQIKSLQNPSPAYIAFVLRSMMVVAIDLHHPGKHGGIFFYARSGGRNHGEKNKLAGSSGH